MRASSLKYKLKDFTKLDYVVWCRQHWQWIAKNPKKHKADWSEYKKLMKANEIDSLASDCFACHYVYKSGLITHKYCHNCLFDWSYIVELSTHKKSKQPCMNSYLGLYFYLTVDVEDYKHISKIAHEISNLEVNGQYSFLR